MKQLSAVFLGGTAQGGLSPYACRVLFGTAGDMMRRTLTPLTDSVYFCGEGVEIDGVTAVRSLEEIDAEQVLLIGLPFVTTDETALPRLLETHAATGCDVTVLSVECDSYDAEGTPMANGLPYAALMNRATVQAVAKTAAPTLESLVQAAVLGGAQRGVVFTDYAVAVADGASAYAAQALLMEQINFSHIENGVQIFDPEHTYIASDAVIAPGAVILPGCHIRPGCKVGAGAVIGPNSILEQAEIGEETTVNNSQVYESVIGTHGTVGPFAYIRPGCRIGDHARIGDFVELKKAEIGNGTKVSHLTYIGDATVGERVNFGCGTVVVNYDGYQKCQTVIGDDCFIGCNTNLISPVTLGDRVFTAAGTTVTKNVPDGALAVARARQSTLEGWNDRRRKAHEKDGK